jgi:hypothetical protein
VRAECIGLPSLVETDTETDACGAAQPHTVARPRCSTMSDERNDGTRSSASPATALPATTPTSSGSSSIARRLLLFIASPGIAPAAGAGADSAELGLGLGLELERVEQRAVGDAAAPGSAASTGSARRRR